MPERALLINSSDMKTLDQNYQVREASANEAEIIAGFQSAMALETEGVNLEFPILCAGVEAVFNHPHHGKYYVLETGGIIVASLLITLEWSDWRNQTIWWIQSVYVLPDYRQSGCYSKMYAHIKALANENPGVGGIRLYVDKSNQKAIHVYRRLGMDDGHYSLFEWMKGRH